MGLLIKSFPKKYYSIMDKLTHVSITNCIKELDALALVIASGEYSIEKIEEWVVQISWELARVMQRRRYDSDELQCVVRKILKDKKKG
jgi:hypothetical protein